MEDIKNLSNKDIVEKLKECKLWVNTEKERLCKRERKAYEKKLFLSLQKTSSAPAVEIKNEQNEYFLLDLDLPSNYPRGKSILRRKKSKNKSVRFRQTEIFGNQPIHPYCVEKYGHDTKNNHLHAPQCSNASEETIGVLGEHRWLNRLFLIKCRYKRVGEPQIILK